MPLPIRDAGGIAEAEKATEIGCGPGGGGGALPPPQPDTKVMMIMIRKGSFLFMAPLQK